MGLITKMFHNKLVYSRRMERLTELVTPLLKNSKNILDLGCGDGKIDSLLLQKCHDINIQGVDVLVREDTYIPVIQYNGRNIPYEDESFDTVMAIDVLHHTDNPDKVLQEMARVSGKYIILKDHIKHGFLSYITLRAMDYVGNAHYKVRLPYNYQTNAQWKRLFNENNLHVLYITKDLNLYKGLFHYLFDRKLHFIAVLEKN